MSSAPRDEGRSCCCAWIAFLGEAQLMWGSAFVEPSRLQFLLQRCSRVISLTLLPRNEIENDCDRKEIGTSLTQIESCLVQDLRFSCELRWTKSINLFADRLCCQSDALKLRIQNWAFTKVDLFLFFDTDHIRISREGKLAQRQREREREKERERERVIRQAINRDYCNTDKCLTP